MVAHILDDLEGIISKILKHTSWDRTKVEEKIRTKQEEYGGLLTPAGAAYSIAKEHNVPLEEAIHLEKPEGLKLNDLADGMGSVNIKARITDIYSTKHFHKNGRSGTVTNAMMQDGTAQKRLVIWGNHDLLSQLRRNSVIKIDSAYTRKNNDQIELHLGHSTTVTIEENDNELPKSEIQNIRLSEINLETPNIDAYARIQRVFPTTTFEKTTGPKAGTPGKVCSCFISDGTATKRLVLWDDNAESCKDFKTNDLIKIEGGYPRDNQGETEINIGWKGRVIKVPEEETNIPKIKFERVKISELKENTSDIEVKAKVVKVYPPTLIHLCSNCKAYMKGDECENCGPQKTTLSLIINAELDDDSGAIRASFYRELAEKIIGITGQEYQDKGEELFGPKAKEITGKEKVFYGYVKLNQNMNRLEFVVKNYSDAGEPRENIEIETTELNE